MRQDTQKRKEGKGKIAKRFGPEKCRSKGKKIRETCFFEKVAYMRLVGLGGTLGGEKSPFRMVCALQVR